ncbi:hypothetical protein [Streptomyces uncialis]|uniref:hypothetical protein n=1 Tax=Streptomyces uncialis TaxID=1048205 RepID=UPI002255144C|nr:hypothetical protein [Streptomyces uncialis]MCX4660350.1 hypothetical protein [Streptomyces uncialis]
MPAPGLAGQRPPGFGSTRYEKRNTVERAISKLMQLRPSPPAVATSAGLLPRRRHR